MFGYYSTFSGVRFDGTRGWFSRHYSVSGTDTAGVWEYSALDSGIGLDERWHILGVDDDLKWLVLFFVGVARRAGMVYRGCLLLTMDGQMPAGEDLKAAEAAIARAGLRPWELVAINNLPLDPSDPPPLRAPKSQPPSPLLESTSWWRRHADTVLF